MNKKQLRKELVEIGKRIAEEKLVIGPGGNSSARLGNIIYMKASGIPFESAKEEHYIGVDLKTGKIVDGKLKPSCEISMHLGCYRVRNDIGAVLHSHGPYSVAYGMLGKELKAFTPDFIAVVKTNIPLVKYVVPSTNVLAEVVKEPIKNHNGVLLANHGLLTVGSNLKEAFYRTLLVEDAIKTIIYARALGVRMRFFTEKEFCEIDNLKAESYRRKLLSKILKD